MAVAVAEQTMQLSAVLLHMQKCNVVQKLSKLFMTLWHCARLNSQS